MKDNKALPIFLCDLDGTVAAYEEALMRDLETLRSPSEPPITELFRDKEPAWLKARMNLIRASATWWENLPVISSGMKIVELARSIGFRVTICTAGPDKNAEAWAGKMRWRLKHMPFADMTMTREKDIVYGKALFDDFPEYIENWLVWRKRGLVIMPVAPYNQKFTHKNVIRWDGSEEAYREISKELTRIYQSATKGYISE